MCGSILKVKPNEVIKTLTVDAYNKRLFFVILQTLTYGSHKSRIVITNLDGGKREYLLTKDTSFVTTLACDPYKKMLYYTDLHQKTLQAISYRKGSKSNAVTIIQKGNVILNPSGITWYENQVFIVNLGATEAIRCNLYGLRQCKAFNLNIYNADAIVIDGASRQPMNRNPCAMAQCRGMCIQSEFGYECMCGNDIVSETKHCDNNNEITASALLIDRTQIYKANGTSHTTTVVWSVLTLIALLLSGLGYLYYRRKQQGQRDFIRNLHFQNPLASFLPQSSNKTGTIDSGLTATGTGSSTGTTEASFEVDRDKLQMGSTIQRFMRGSTSKHGSQILLETAKVNAHSLSLSFSFSLSLSLSL